MHCQPALPTAWGLCRQRLAKSTSTLDVVAATWSQGLLNKKPADRLGWPDLLDHPFVRETHVSDLQCLCILSMN
jgi:hypothetical protein